MSKGPPKWAGVEILRSQDEEKWLQTETGEVQMGYEGEIFGSEGGEAHGSRGSTPVLEQPGPVEGVGTKWA